MPDFRGLWEAWDQNPVSVSNRKFIYRVFGPMSVAGLIWMAAIGQWVAVGFMAVFLAIALESGARTPGTHARRIFSRLRGRRADA